MITRSLRAYLCFTDIKQLWRLNKVGEQMERDTKQSRDILLPIQTSEDCFESKVPLRFRNVPKYSFDIAITSGI